MSNKNHTLQYHNLKNTYLSTCVDSVQTALAALLELIKLFPRKSNARPLVASLIRSWMGTGWMTGLLPSDVSCSVVYSLDESVERPCATAESCWD